MAENILNSRQAQLSKLKGLREHLEALLQKRARLELEIKSLRKTYSKRKKEINNKTKSVKISLSLESLLNDEIPATDPDLKQTLEALEGQLAVEQIAIEELFEEALAPMANLEDLIEYLERLQIPVKEPESLD